MSIQVREASMADIPELVGMKIAMFAEAGRASLLPPDASSRIAADYRLMYADGLARHFVADEGGSLVATVGAFLKDDLPYRYFAHSRYQSIVTVRLLASEAGRPMYEKLGFTPTDEMVLHLQCQTPV